MQKSLERTSFSEAVDKVSTASEAKMGTSEKVPIFAWIVREGGLPVPLHRSPLQDQLGLQGFVYSLFSEGFFMMLIYQPR
jgi:hypothetical protein